MRILIREGALNWYGMRKILMQDGEFVLTANKRGEHLIFHCHCDECGGGRNGAPYWASCYDGECRDCPARIPHAMVGMMELARWNPGKTAQGML